MNERSTSAPDDSSPSAEPTRRILDRKLLLHRRRDCAGGRRRLRRVFPRTYPFVKRSTGRARQTCRSICVRVEDPFSDCFPADLLAGPRTHYLDELKRTAGANVYIGYLPSGADVGASGDFLTIGTFPHDGAFAALKHTADGHAIPVLGGGLALVDSSKPNSVHVAFPNVAYDVEVTDSSPARALAVVKSGEVGPAS